MTDDANARDACRVALVEWHQASVTRARVAERNLNAMGGNMSRMASVVLGLVSVLMVTGCASSRSSMRGEQTTTGTSPSLVGAWIVTASRPGGVGKNMLTFSSDGTFFRSGDTHPVVSGAHGAWKRVSDKEYHATYIAFRFDQTGKWIGSNVTRIRVTLGPDASEFTGLAKVSVRDLQDKEERTSESRLQGRRIQVEPF